MAPYKRSNLNLIFLILIGIPLSALVPTNSVKAQARPMNPQDIGEKWLNVDYAGDTIIGHRMDIYLPKEGTAPYPVIVTIAGSAWGSNNVKDRGARIGTTLLKQGFAIVAINHRSSREAIFPAQIQDVKGAIRFLRANAKKYKLDTSFLGITGDSSGGHLSTLTATSGGVTTFTVGTKTLDLEGSVGGNKKESSRVNAVVDWYGPTDFLAMDSCDTRMTHNSADSPESRLLGGQITLNKDLVTLANPITYIDKNDPPILILHGDSDRLVPMCESLLLQAALTKKGIPNKMISVTGGAHGGDVTWDDKNVAMMRQYFNEMKNNRKNIKTFLMSKS